MLASRELFEWEGDSTEIVPLDIKFYDLFKDLDFKLRNRIIWHF